MLKDRSKVRQPTVTATIDILFSNRTLWKW